MHAPVSYRPKVGKAKLSPIKDGLRILGTTIRLMRDTHTSTVVLPVLLMIGAMYFFTLGLVADMIKRMPTYIQPHPQNPSNKFNLK